MARARTGRVAASRALALAIAVLSAGSLRAASSPDMAPSLVGDVPSHRACHLRLCLRRGATSCELHKLGAIDHVGVAGAQIEHTFLLNDEILGRMRRSEDAATLLPLTTIVAELIPIPLSVTDAVPQRPRYSTRSRVLDDGVSLTTSIIVEDPGHYQLVHGLVQAGGLTGSFFDNTGLHGTPVASQKDATIDVDWGLGAIAGLSGVDYVSARWCGYLAAEDVPMARKMPNGERYVIWLDLGAETDGARLWMNGTLIIDAWDRGHERLPSTNVLLRPGALSSITLEYKHLRGPAAIRLLWSSPWATLQPIPSRNLFHADPAGETAVIRIESGRPFNASLVIGEGMSILTAGAAVHYKMSAVDAYGNAAGSSERGKLLLCSTSVDDVRTVVDNASQQTLQPSSEAVSDLTGGFEGLVRLTTAGHSQLEALYGAAGALSATYYVSDDLISYVPVATSLWRGSLTSAIATQSASPTLVFREGYSARWAGFVHLPNATDFAFYTEVESETERMKLWLDNALLIDQWNSLSSLQPSATFIPAASGSLYRIALEYHDGLDTVSSELANPGLSLEWESPAGSGSSTPRTVIPSSSLFSAMLLAVESIQVLAGYPDPRTSILHSDESSMAGSAHNFRIVVKDEYGNTARPDETDAPSVQCKSRGLEALLDQASLQVEATLRRDACSKCALPEGYSGSVTPLVSGGASLWALLAGWHIQGSPMHLEVSPGTIVASRSEAKGDALSISTAGTQASFTILAKDEHGNLAEPAPPGLFAVMIKRNDSRSNDARHAGVEHEKSRAGIDMFPLDMGPLDLVPEQQEASAWRLAFRVTHSGHYGVHVKWAGEHVSGSPFLCRVTYGKTCSVTSFARGDGLTATTAGVPASFSILARDEYGNALTGVTSWSGRYFVPILYSNDAQVRPQHLGIKPDDRPEHPTVVSTTRGGGHTMHVLLASAGGLAATYYSDPNLLASSARESVVTGQVVDWSSQIGDYTPEWNSGAGQQQYGARWSGLIRASSDDLSLTDPFAMYYRLRSPTERLKLWLDTVLLVDQWTSLSGTEASANIQLSSETGLYDLKVEYRDSRQFNTTQRGLRIETGGNGGRTAMTRDRLMYGIPVITPQVHETSSARVEAVLSTLHGVGLTILTAGVASELTLIARDTYGNLINDPVSWIQKSLGQKDPYSSGSSISIVSTVAGTYSYEVKLLQVGGLQATFYSDARFDMPSISAPALSDLGKLSTTPLAQAIDARLSYYSIRWSGYLKLPEQAEYTFYADSSVPNRLVINGTLIFDHVPSSVGQQSQSGGAASSFGFLRVARGSQLPYGLPLLAEMRHVSGIRSAGHGLEITYATGREAGKIAISAGSLLLEDSAANSPFTASVQSAPVCSAKSVPYGSGLTLVTAGRLAIFFVQSKDEFSNNIVNEFTTCTTSSSCAYGQTLGVLSSFRPSVLGIQSRRVISSYNSDGVWDMLVIAITISGKYYTDISLAYVGGLDSTYYQASGGHDRQSPLLARSEETISVNSSDLGIGMDYSQAGYEAVWSGHVSIPCLSEDSCSEYAKESFTFTSEITSDDRVKLWLDNRLVIDQWTSLHGVSPTGTIGLDESGRLWDIIVEYKHAPSNQSAIFNLKWTLNTATPRTAAVIPSTHLYRSAPVGSSPYQSRVWPASQAGDYLTFTAMTVLTVGTSSYFTVTARDAFNNPRDFGHLFTFKTYLLGSDIAFFNPTLENGTTTDGLFYATGTSEFQLQQVSEYLSTLVFLNLGGLQATYYESSGFVPPKRANVVKTVDLCPTTGCGSRPLSSNLDANTAFSAVFDGAVMPPVPSTYTLKVTVKDPSDRMRLWIDDVLVIDQWASLFGVSAQASVSMALTNAHYDLTLKYRHVNVGIGYGCRLEWKASTDSSFLVIPSSQMYQRYKSETYAFRTVPSSTCYVTSTASSVGLTLATAGLRNVFTITARDEYGNAVSRDGSRFVAEVGNSGLGLMSEADQDGTFSAVHVSSNSKQNLISVAAIEVGGLSRAYYDNAVLEGKVALSEKTPGPVDVSWSDHILPWRRHTSSSILWHGYLRGDCRTGVGLMATYYSNTSLSSAAAMKAVGQRGAGSIDFSQFSAHGMSVLDGDMYSVRWAGFVRPTYSQTYIFYSHLVSMSDRVKLWIDGQLLINEWSSLMSLNSSSPGVSMSEDAFHSIDVEFAHASPSSNASGLSILWSASRFGIHALPQSFLHPRNFSNQDVPYTFYVSRMQKAVLSIGGAVVIDTSRMGAPDQDGRYSGEATLETDVLYRIRLEYPDAPASGGALLEWSTPDRPVAREVEASLLFYQPESSDYISGSPFELFLEPNKPDAAQSTLRKRTTGQHVVGSHIVFDLVARDAYGNVLERITDDGSAAFVAILSHKPKAYYSFFSTKHKRQEVAIRKALFPADGSFNVNLTSTVAGTHSIEAWLALAGGLSATYYSDASLVPAKAETAGWWHGPLDWSCTWSTPTVAQQAVRWSGFLRAPLQATYTIKALLQTAQDQVKVWVDDEILIDEWGDAASQSPQVTINLAYGSFYHIVIEYKTSVPWVTRGISLQWKSSGPQFDQVGTNSLFAARRVDPLEPPFQTSFLPSIPVVRTISHAQCFKGRIANCTSCSACAHPALKLL